MLVSDLVKQGLRCPSCRGKKLRAGYHDFHNMDAFICERCGFRWQEDTNEATQIVRQLEAKKRDDKAWKTRFIWVMHSATNPKKPLKNPKSSDETSFEAFVKEAS